MLVVTYRKVFFALSGIIVAAAIASIAVFGLNFGIEFTGGELIETKYAERPAKVAVEAQLNELELGAYSLRAAGDDEFILRVRPLEENERNNVFTAMTQVGEGVGTIERFNSVGPTIGTELRNKAWIAILAVVLAIILFIAIAFRKVSEPVSSWKYGFIAIIALLHDVIIPTGLFAALGYFFGAEVDVLFVMALLAILGYSVNDTIVVFDRVRENLRENEEKNRREDFELTVGKSLNQTYMRSINTSITTLVVLLALFFIGSEVTQDFALILIAGVLAGTYSSLFLATPLLVTVQKWTTNSA
ncbi:MAG: protein translocase subunit SecF [Parcubacteria group bacterium]|nr:protein translocase subunit SecF [Parcubacteria group bacterium]|tara:strand:+ start:4223 stop:5128 length:906 start_codon:yes stop_codon:yes gene_type:complete